MTTENGKKLGSLIAIIYALAMTVYVLADKVIAPSHAGAVSVEVVERLARVEECTKRLETIPQNMATLTQATADLKVSVDRLEHKIDEHITRGK